MQFPIVPKRTMIASKFLAGLVRLVELRAQRPGSTCRDSLAYKLVPRVSPMFHSETSREFSGLNSAIKRMDF
jgi:hypothetical protein